MAELHQSFGGVRLGEIILQFEHINTRLIPNSLRTNVPGLLKNLLKIPLDLLRSPNLTHRTHQLPKHSRGNILTGVDALAYIRVAGPTTESDSLVRQILVDTNIISTAYLPEPPQWIWEWLGELPRGALAVSWITIYETEVGIRAVQRHNVQKALELLAWFEEFLSSRMIQPEMDVVAARVLGAMAAHPPLRHFFHTPERRDRHGRVIKQDRVNLGCDAMLAALAIAHGLPIATLNPADFCLIHQHFSLPGVYDPRADVWHVEPPPGWHVGDAANEDLEPTEWTARSGRP
ncbi:putative nucleic acid-binding protein [Rhizobium sp. BK650]|uniref:type II toxin-antitoxin system VapC family toxin n=1 Tax=Rhizobium sp. BK650 TaxID=2586990 RepID=UPI001859A21D|nr:PIN domain-containing protein [Rhizobium sp. BK650]MBB3658409.1 putative nucleic acid-binding protein [Rhizobium sp. BK650]